jgi:two-component system sensor histidine kinase UhpB
VARLAEAGRTEEIPAALQGIGDAVGHMQAQVRGMLGRLRPAGLDEFGLADALGDLVEFWRRRMPGIECRITVDPGCEGQGDVVDTTIYRIVQEGLSNAVRHGRPGRIEASVRLDRSPAHPGGGRILVEIADDGRGAPEGPRTGFGLLAMAERVEGLGGGLESAARPEGGFRVLAWLPQAEGPAGRSAIDPE